MQSLKSVPENVSDKVWQCRAQNIPSFLLSFVSAQPTSQPRTAVFTRSERSAKRLPSAFIVALINGDAGEASRCQTCSAQRQQQVHRLGREPPGCVG